MQAVHKTGLWLIIAPSVFNFPGFEVPHALDASTQLTGWFTKTMET